VVYGESECVLEDKFVVAQTLFCLCVAHTILSSTSVHLGLCVLTPIPAKAQTLFMLHVLLLTHVDHIN
jgi:hypothetical protein